uniref:DNA 3'-5' helicase n=1 Tax=uncultured marine group II/III euryarchaeote KM3_92_B07 TaxID=1456543 RepID=A0A075I454_9EURY|nr:superfamily I DNA/RNA helicase (uvrD, pcrA) [uncultured marine group II/III euryarchaeote KM3_92_B07]
MVYTEAQQLAIEHRGGHLQIIACAGSGKTQVLVERILGLLKDGIDPAGIIAFTFTEKAAAELKERVRDAIRDDELEIMGLAEMYIGTIHGWCLNFLQNEMNRYLKFSVLNEVQTKLLISRYSQMSGLKHVTFLSGAETKRSKYDVRNYHAMLNILREDEVDWGQVPEQVAEALDMYRELLRDNALFDYSELLYRVVEGFRTRDPEWVQAKENLGKRLKHVLVDEYQDVNPVQERLVNDFANLGALLTVVGDDDQTIYQWRGSAVSNILTFADRYPDVTTIQVTTNFRSTSAIVETAQRIAENNTERLDKEFHAGSHLVHEDGDLLALNFDDEESQALDIAERISNLLGQPFQDSPDAEPRGLAFSDMAILMRSVRNDAGPIIEALRESNIPFIVKGVQQLFEQPEIIAARALFLYLSDQVSPPNLVNAWLDADIGLEEDVIEDAISELPEISNEGDDRWVIYNLQRVFLDFLKNLGLIEDDIPDPLDVQRGALMYHNLGMFSQVLSDFEQIHFKSDPERKYETFAYWIQQEAPDLYDEGGLEGSYHQPDAVQILTIHQAKGLQWPVVFVPTLTSNRFPARLQGGRTVWHMLPAAAVNDQVRYLTSIDDERRLFYVAVTRAKKFVFCSFAPRPKRGYQNPSIFMQEFVNGGWPLTNEPVRDWPAPITPTPKIEIPTVSISFSEWKYFSECAYMFKLRFMYGFNPPIHEALGYGKSLHDALAEAHRLSIDGSIPTAETIPYLLERHLHLPFAYPSLKVTLEAAAVNALERYFRKHERNLVEATHSEQSIEFSPMPGLIVHGRIDLVTEKDTGIVRLIDFKSSDRVQEEEVTRDQLLTYAAGFEELTGSLPDYVEVCNLDPKGEAVREVVQEGEVARTVARLGTAAAAIRGNEFHRVDLKEGKCVNCELAGICRSLK